MLTLNRGDKVALVAPASGQKIGQENLIDTALEVLVDWGLDIVQMPTLDTKRYLAADDQQRAESLLTALTTPDIKAIFITRGGYGSARLLPYLQDIHIPSPRFLVGFSDVTTLHLHFQQTTTVVCVHASNLATDLFLANHGGARLNQQSLKDYLFSGSQPTLSPTYLCGTIDENSDWSQPMTGGCLSLLVTSLGTSHEIDTDNKIVMIEEVCESPYKIDRMLTHLKNAGKFKRANAVVIGDLTKCNSPTIDVLDVIRDVFSDSACPVYHSPTFGHGTLNLPWCYG